MEEAHDLIGEHSTADEPERIALQEHAASLAGDAALAEVHAACEANAARLVAAATGGVTGGEGGSTSGLMQGVSQLSVAESK